MKKKLLSILLCAALIFSYAPVNETTAKAAGGVTGGTAVESVWSNFRNSDGNMAITSAKTPINSQEAELKWAKSLGSGWSANPSAQIIVDNSIVVMSGTKIYKLSMETGEVKASADMVGSPSFGYTPPTYGDGMIFAPLGNGTIQAFDASTLESLWVYRDAKGGQALSPITYSDGCIYTGFWKNETDEASFVCIAVDDEDTTNTKEDKLSKWTLPHAGGFYWAGAVAVGSYIVVQSDNGTSDNTVSGKLYVLDKTNGSVIDSADISGDGRSCIAYDSQSGNIYFTTKNASFYKGKVDPTTGAISGLASMSLGTNTYSTSTPVVYKGYAFIADTDYKVHTVKMIDVGTMEVKASVSMPGYPQCSLLLSNAYEKETGKIYLYSTYNKTPGGITVIEADLTSGTMTSQELYDASGHQNYCIASLICDDNGTLYYKNDSGYVLAVSNSNASKEASVTGITLSSSSLSLAVGGQQTLTGNVSYDGAAPAVSTINWSSLDEAVAKVDANGKVTGEGIGSAVITAECGGVSADCQVTVHGVAEDITAYVNISIGGTFASGKDNAMMAEVPVNVSDDDKDGKIELLEVLAAVHTQYYTGEGTGYGTVDYNPGIYIGQLWGNTTTAAGYYKNNEYVSEDLSAEVENDDHVTFFTYADTASWSDMYTFFKDRAYTDKEKVNVELLGWGYGADWSLVKSPVSGVQMSLYNEKGEKLKEGSYTIEDNGDGSYTVSGLPTGTYKLIASSSEEKTIVPDTCNITISQKEVEDTDDTIDITPTNPVDTGDSTVTWIWVVLLVAAVAAVVVIIMRRKKQQ